jgi:hypothetical protein
MYKKIAIVADLDWFQSDTIEAIYSVSGCISNDFTDYIHYWKHNEFWFFDTPAVIEEIAANENLDISNMTLLYYEVYEEEYNDSTNCWQPFAIDSLRGAAQPVNVILPREKRLEGFDIVSYSQSSKHECSPLSCNGMFKEIPVNRHCLFESFDEARNALACGRFKDCEPGPYRIIAVHTVLHFA